MAYSDKILPTESSPCMEHRVSGRDTQCRSVKEYNPILNIKQMRSEVVPLLTQSH